MEVDREDQHLVNGALMKKYVGQSVRLYLNVMNTSTGGRQVSEIARICDSRNSIKISSLQVQGTSTDKKTVNVALEQPLNQPLSGWIEVFGTPTENGSTINCSEVILMNSTIYFSLLTHFNFLLDHSLPK